MHSLPTAWKFCNKHRRNTEHLCLGYFGPREDPPDEINGMPLIWLTRHEIWECMGCKETFYQRTIWHNLNQQGVDIHFFGSFAEYDGDLIEERFPAALLRQVSPYADKDILDLINKPEDSFLEFKSSLSYDTNRRSKNDDLHGSVLKTVSAFLNSKGGILIIGIDDKGEILGIQEDIDLSKNRNIDSFQLKLQDLFRNHINPLQYNNIDIKFVQTNQNKDLCGIYISPSNEIVYYQNTVYVRNGNQTISLFGKDLERWISERRT